MNNLFKKMTLFTFALLMAATSIALSGCQEKKTDPGRGVDVNAPGVDVKVKPKEGENDNDKKTDVDVDVK